MLGGFANIARVAIGCVLLSSPTAFADQPRSSTTSGEEAVRTLIAQWIEAYMHLDARRLAALEAPDVVVVDKFGELHLPAGRNENEKLWSDTFEVISRNSAPPIVTIDHIQFLRPDVAIVQVSWRFPKGILLVDGSRIPPFSEVDSYTVIKGQDIWLVAAHNMQEKKP